MVRNDGRSMVAGGWSRKLSDLILTTNTRPRAGGEYGGSLKAHPQGHSSSSDTIPSKGSIKSQTTRPIRDQVYKYLRAWETFLIWATTVILWECIHVLFVLGQSMPPWLSLSSPLCRLNSRLFPNHLIRNHESPPALCTHPCVLTQSFICICLPDTFICLSRGYIHYLILNSENRV